MPKRYLLIIFLVTSYTFAYSQNRLDTLLNERQNIYQDMIYRLNPSFNDTFLVSVVNRMSEYDKLISDEAHKIDSVILITKKNMSLNDITLQDLKFKKDKAFSYFYISLILLIINLLLLITLFEKNKNLKKEVAFLDSDINDANNNYSKVSDEKYALQRETSIKIKSLNDKLHLITNEKSFLTDENLEMKKIISEMESELKSLKEKNNYTNNEENKLLREAVKLLENEKCELSDEIEKLKKVSLKTNTVKNDDFDYIKFELTKRIDHLENALKAKEIMESVIVNKHKEYEENIKILKETNEQLSVELEDEKAYNDKLNNKIAFFEEEIAEKENELKNLWTKITSQPHTSTLKTDNDKNFNMIKTIEKLNRLKQAEILSDNEFETLKDKIINQI